MSNAIDITGQRFGRLTAVCRESNNKRGEARWRCKCDCGNEIITIQHSLRSGNTSSCGCIRKEQLAERNKQNAKHGMKGTRLYQTWHNMKDRCFRKNHAQYADYGGRGITVCPEWTKSFEAFRDWAMDNGYQDDLTLDRRDTNGSYTPDNCRWATQKEQSNNRRSNRLITFNGETHTLKKWSEIYDIPYALLKNRIRAGMPMERAILKIDMRRCNKPPK